MNVIGVVVLKRYLVIVRHYFGKTDARSHSLRYSIYHTATILLLIGSHNLSQEVVRAFLVVMVSLPRYSQDVRKMFA